MRLRPEHLVDGEKGLKLLYDKIKKEKFVTDKDMDPVKKLRLLTSLYSDWQFNLIAKYDKFYFVKRT